MNKKERKEHVQQWARDLISVSFVVLDTETTGLTPGKIVDIAIIDGLSGEVLVDTLVNPQEPISAGASAVHHITDEMVKDAPTFTEIMPDVERILSKKTCVIYNVDFDRAFLKVEGLDVDGCRFECAMQQFALFYGEYSEYYGDYKFQPLVKACRTLSIVIENQHRARSDALACLHMIRRLAELT